MGLVRLYCAVALVFLAVFASFAWLGAWAVCAVSVLRGVGDDPSFLIKQGVKGALFAFVTASAIFALWRMRIVAPHEEPAARPAQRITVAERLGLAAVLAFVAALAIPFLGRYPEPSPDELHHLVVARNLAEFGVYGSGNPATGFVWFDHMDSVGPPVILPVAGMLALFPRDIVAARSVVAGYALAFGAVVYFFCRDVFGAAASLLAVGMSFMAFGTVFLSRSIYGELPALVYVLLGLYCWRRAIEPKHAVFWSLAAGLLLGLAILSKTFIVVGVWAVFGVFLYDFLFYKKLRVVHALYPAAGVVAVVGAWWTVQALMSHNIETANANTFLLYRHYLLFGFDSVSRPLGWLFGKPLTLLTYIAAMGWVVPTLFRRRYDPPWTALYFAALLFLAWWVFFTPGQLIRYSWYSSTIAAMIGAAFLVFVVRNGVLANRAAWIRAAALAVLVLALWEGVSRTSIELRNTYLRNPSEDETALVAHLDAAAEDTPMSTLYWPVTNLMNFFTLREAPYVPSADESKAVRGILVAYDGGRPVDEGVFALEARYGPYLVYTRRTAE